MPVEGKNLGVYNEAFLCPNVTSHMTDRRQLWVFLCRSDDWKKATALCEVEQVQPYVFLEVEIIIGSCFFYCKSLPCTSKHSEEPALRIR